MTEGYVYRWTDSSNGKKYIGSHCGKNKYYKGSGTLFKRAYNIRPECFTREILYTGPDYLELEEFILETVDAKNDDMYYNMINTSTNPVLFGEENPFYGKKHTEESRRKMSESQKGKKHTPETIERMRQAKLGHKHSEETLEKMRDFHISDETREKLRQAGLGEKNHMYGKKHTKESRLKMSENTFSRPVIELSTGLRFDSIRKCATYFNLDRSTVAKQIKRNKPVSRGPNKGKHYIYEKQNN